MNPLNRFISTGLWSCYLLSCRAAPVPERAVYTPPQIIQEAGAIAPQSLNLQRLKPLRLESATDPNFLTIQPQATGARVVTSQGIQLAELTIAGDKIRLANAIGQHVANVVVYRDRWRLETPDQTEIMTLRRHQAPERYQLKTPTFQPLYRLQGDASGWSLVTPDHQMLYEVQPLNQQLGLRNAAGYTVLTSSGNVNAIALACFGLDVLTREQQAALAYAVQGVLKDEG